MNMIKVGLPGESLWAHEKDGVVKLENDSIHGVLKYGDVVKLGEDGYTIVEPKSAVEAAERNVREVQAG